MNKIYHTDDFTIEVITKGAFLDDDPGLNTRFLVETIVFRANYIALNEYLLKICASNDRYTYDTEEEWQDYLKTKKANRDARERHIAELLDIDTETCSLSITQSLSEVFTAVAIRRIPKTDIKEEE